MAHGSYKKWLCHYLDFCEKYHFPAQHRENLPEFLGKLEEKRQSKAQQEQAASAIGVSPRRASGQVGNGVRPRRDRGIVPIE
jgi:hypothetical protein